MLETPLKAIKTKAYDNYHNPIVIYYNASKDYYTDNCEVFYYIDFNESLDREKLLPIIGQICDRYGCIYQYHQVICKKQATATFDPKIALIQAITAILNVIEYNSSINFSDL